MRVQQQIGTMNYAMAQNGMLALKKKCDQHKNLHEMFRILFNEKSKVHTG